MKTLPQKITFAELQENTLFFNCILSLGEACRPAIYLKEHNLRYFSSPFDWMRSYPLSTIQNFIDNGFDNFFKNREIVSKAPARKHMVIRDADTGMISMHHFPIETDMDTHYKFFIKQMTTQFSNFIQNIAQSKILAFISNGWSTEELKKFKSFIDNKFNKNCHMINMIHNMNEEYILLDKYAQIYEFHFNDLPSSPRQFWLGNQNKWNYVMSNIHLI